VTSTTRKEFFNLPNYITFGRLACVPVLVVLMLFTRGEGMLLELSPAMSLLSAFVFIAAMLSDLVDGYYARKRNLTSTFGKFFDPLADKMLFIAAMIMMIPLGRIPAWLVVIFFVREVIITALRGVAIDKNIVIAASEWGKYKSVFVSIACVGLLLHYPFMGLQWRLMGWVFMLPALVFSIGSGVHYTAGFVKALKGSNGRTTDAVQP
jgi:CDP-diacylglycerol---glycerol-3-phosphate 3-phosphatidyltransferase